MRFRPRQIGCLCLILLTGVGSAIAAPDDKAGLPAFGKDTVLVWKIENLEFTSSFVVRIAQFSPDRYLEWEDEQTQGMIFMPGQDMLEARGFVNSSLFISGGEARGKKATTLWLSRHIYRELKEKKKAKCTLDGVQGAMNYLGEDQISVEVNRSARKLPVIRVMDDRGSERWFLDLEENPLMVLHKLRNFTQTLSSITTDKANTLRWIKGKKLANPSGSY
jgi:hypothetical protein